MSLLQQVQRGRSHLPPRILVYGTEGVGKSSLAATTPKPIFIQTEDGLVRSIATSSRWPNPSRMWSRHSRN